jgi:hypothetical protein
LDTSGHLLNNLYDVYGYSATGTLTLGTGPAWSYTATITVTIATPAVVTWTGHALPEGTPVVFTTSGALPTGITAGTTYFVGRSPGANTLNISTTVANAAAGTFIATSGSQSGVHTGTNHTIARGTGAGTTELQYKSGVWTNKNSITLTNNSATASISANQATYLGTFFATANGQTGCAFNPSAGSGGSNPILGLYNAYNRVLLTAANRDSTSSWTYGTATWRSSNGNVGNRVSFVDGLGQSPIFGWMTALSASALQPANGMVAGSTNGTPRLATTNNAGVATFVSGATSEQWRPALGYRYVQMVEDAIAGSCTFYGDPWSQLMVGVMQ